MIRSILRIIMSIIINRSTVLKYRGVQYPNPGLVVTFKLFIVTVFH